MWCRDVGLVVQDVSKERCAFIFRVRQFRVSFNISPFPSCTDQSVTWATDTVANSAFTCEVISTMNLQAVFWDVRCTGRCGRFGETGCLLYIRTVSEAYGRQDVGSTAGHQRCVSRLTNKISCPVTRTATQQNATVCCPRRHCPPVSSSL